MMNEKLNLSALDPAQNTARWENILQSVVLRAWQERRSRLTLHVQLMSWARPALGIAAGLALVSWAGAWAQEGKRGETRADSALTLVQWAEGESLPAPLEVLQTLGGRP